MPMLQDRNLTVHTYNEETAQQIWLTFVIATMLIPKDFGERFSGSQQLANERLIWTHPTDHSAFADGIC